MSIVMHTMNREILEFHLISEMLFRNGQCFFHLTNNFQFFYLLAFCVCIVSKSKVYVLKSLFSVVLFHFSLFVLLILFIAPALKLTRGLDNEEIAWKSNGLEYKHSPPLNSLWNHNSAFHGKVQQFDWFSWNKISEDRSQFSARSLLGVECKRYIKCSGNTFLNAQGLCYNTTIFIFLDKMVRPVVKLNNRSTEMEIKALKLSSDMKESLRAPIIWERPSNAKMYDYHYEISGLYYQVT